MSKTHISVRLMAEVGEAYRGKDSSDYVEIVELKLSIEEVRQMSGAQILEKLIWETER
jgi:hypothetical protein